MLNKSTAGHLAGPIDPAGLVLERLPNGEYAWLRRELDAAIRDADRLDQDLTRLLERRPKPTADDVGYVLTDKGRRALAMEACFGRPWPTAAEACGLDQQGAA